MQSCGLELPCDLNFFSPCLLWALSFLELCLLWDVSDCAHYYYGMFMGMGGVNVPMVTVAKGHSGMGKSVCVCM